jgi:putative transposase
VARKPRWGFWKLYDRLRLDGQCINHKRLHRVYCAMKLNLPRRTKRRLPTRIRQPLAAPAGLNQIWALDFMADALYGGRAFRTLNLIDEGNRQVLGIEVAHSIPSLRVIRVMEQLIELHGKPRALRMDNVLTAESRPATSTNDPGRRRLSVAWYQTAARGTAPSGLPR